MATVSRQPKVQSQTLSSQPYDLQTKPFTSTKPTVSIADKACRRWVLPSRIYFMLSKS
jgi:hypothetical protein